jgi:RNA polymerase sigma-70 factor, ECF subfamily
VPSNIHPMNTAGASDASIFDGSAARSAASFDDAFRAHAGYVLRVLARLGVPTPDVEDAAQEVFLVYHRKAGEFRGESSLRTFLYAIATRVASGHRRRARHRRETTVGDPCTDAIADGSEDVARSEERALLYTLLDTLDDAKREAVVLYQIEELPIRDVARICECTIPTAYARVAAAKRQMRKSLHRLRQREENVRAR